MAASAASRGFVFTGTEQYQSKAHIVFPSKNGPTADVRERLAEAVMKDERVRGVGWQKLIYGKKRQVAIAVMVKERFGKVVIQNARNECGLEDKIEGYGLLKLNGAEFTPLKLIRGDISIIYPGPKPAPKPDRDSRTSEDDEPRKRKAPAHKRQRRPQRAKQQGGRTAAAADSDRAGESGSRNAQQIPSAGTALAAAAAAAVAAATPAPQRTEDVAALQQVQAIATQRGIAASSTDFVVSIKALQDGTAAAQRERAEALATSQIAAENRAELQAAVSAGQKERHDLDVRAGQLSAANTDLKAKLSTAEYQLTSSKTALASVGAELEQKSDANAVLTAHNTELEKRAAANAKTAALLSQKLCSALAMLKEVLPHEVSNVWSSYSFYCSTMLVHACYRSMHVDELADASCRCTVHITLLPLLLFCYNRNMMLAR
jgi:hypothetical protein